MLKHKDRIVVDDALCSICSVRGKQVRHRDFPEIRAECGTVSEGAAHLATRLSSYRDGAQSAWHRETIDLAIADVAEFLEELQRSDPDLEGSCRCGPRAPVPVEPAFAGPPTT